MHIATELSLPFLSDNRTPKVCLQQYEKVTLVSNPT